MALKIKSDMADATWSVQEPMKQPWPGSFLGLIPWLNWNFCNQSALLQGCVTLFEMCSLREHPQVPELGVKEREKVPLLLCKYFLKVREWVKMRINKFCIKVHSGKRMSLTSTNPVCVLQHLVPPPVIPRKDVLDFFWPGLHGTPTGIWSRCQERGSEKPSLNLQPGNTFAAKSPRDSSTVQDCAVRVFLSCFWSSSALPSTQKSHPFVHFFPHKTLLCISVSLPIFKRRLSVCGQGGLGRFLLVGRRGSTQADTWGGAHEQRSRAPTQISRPPGHCGHACCRVSLWTADFWVFLKE